MLDSFGLETLETRRKISKMYKIIHGLVDLRIHNYSQSSKETRTRNSHAYKFQTPFGSKNVFKLSFFQRTSREWDQLSAVVVLSLSLAVFNEKATTLRNNNPNWTSQYICMYIYIF